MTFNKVSFNPYSYEAERERSTIKNIPLDPFFP